VRESWERALDQTGEQKRWAAAKLKSLRTFEARALSNPFAAGDGIKRDRWPKDVRRDYGAVPNLFRFELAERWRGYYTMIGEPGGVRVVVLYLWDHETYSKQSDYAKK
jgi:hypothetical protein